MSGTETTINESTASRAARSMADMLESSTAQQRAVVLRPYMRVVVAAIAWRHNWIEECAEPPSVDSGHDLGEVPLWEAIEDLAGGLELTLATKGTSQ